jgi:cobalamin-dependent methionine synthase I
MRGCDHEPAGSAGFFVEELPMTWCVRTVVLATVFLTACSADGLYATGRNAQRAECMKQPDAAVRERCLKDAGMSRDAYQKGSDALRP